MSAELMILGSETEWLEERRSRIGGSEAAAVLGVSPWMSNLDLYRIKAGLMDPPKIETEATAYGHAAEEHIRELFRLDHPEMTVWHQENSLWINSRYPWAHASLDGKLADASDRQGVLEIKTVTMRSGNRSEWDGRIPDHYYCQLLHYMAVCELDFGILVAQQKYSGRGDVFKVVREYRIEREEVQDDIDALMEAEEAFWARVQDRREPPLALPGI